MSQCSRTLSEKERSLLGLIIQDQRVPSRRELMIQLDAAQIVGGLPMFPHISVPADVPRADYNDGPLPVVASVFDDLGEAVGEIIVWIADGKLSAMEHAWITDEPPNSWPELKNVQLESMGTG